MVVETKGLVRWKALVVYFHAAQERPTWDERPGRGATKTNFGSRKWQSPKSADIGRFTKMNQTLNMNISVTGGRRNKKFGALESPSGLLSSCTRKTKVGREAWAGRRDRVDFRDSDHFLTTSGGLSLR